MKKLNSKGFTLIELLAIIVILAIIMVVTIPTVLNSMDTAKLKQFQNAADSVAEWLQKQYDLDYMGTLGGGINHLYANVVSEAKEENGSIIGLDNFVEMNSELIEAAGIADAEKNIANGLFYYNDEKDRICVMLTSSEDGSFYVVENPMVYSSGCPSE